MKKINIYLLQAICFLLILLWVYAAASKLINFDLFRVQMDKQLLPSFVKQLMIYCLPVTELVVAGLLLADGTRKTALIISGFMLSSFSIYIALVLSRSLGKMPCSCGGIFRWMDWPTHLLVNLCFLLLTAIGIFIVHRERRSARQ